MKHVSMFVLGLLALCTSSTHAQDYPLWLADPNYSAEEYPTAIASEPNYTAVVGFHQEDFEIFDLGYSVYHATPCLACGQDGIFVKWREEGSGNTWTAVIGVDGWFNNHVGAQSVPQVDVNKDGEVYVSFTYVGAAVVEDVSGNQITFTAGIGGNSYNIGIVKFDQNGDYQWHISEGGTSHDYITDLDYNDKTRRLAIAGYVEGTNSALVFPGGTAINPLTWGSPLGLRFGNAFAASYEDNGSNANFIWATAAEVPTYSNDIVQGDNAHVFLSGYFYEAKNIAGARMSGQYAEGGLIYQYFLAGFDASGSSMWAEAYGTEHTELDIASTKRLRHSSLAIIPRSGDLFFAFNNTGSVNSPYFPDFGTYVNHIDPGSGGIYNLMTVGNTGNANGSSIWGSDEGSPTYNPNIAVNRSGMVFISGNFSLADAASSPIGIAFNEMEIGGTYLDHSSTYAGGGVGHTGVVGWYSAIADFGTGNVHTEQLNHTYIPVNPSFILQSLPVYGTAEDSDNTGYFFSALGFQDGELELDLSVNVGIVNSYSISSGTGHYDGLLVRTSVGNGFHAKPNASNDQAATQSRYSDLDANSWVPQPNPAQAGQQVTLQGLVTAADHIQLLDLTGRVLQTWSSVNDNTLSLSKELVPGVYFIRTLSGEVQQSATIVIR